MAFLFSAPFSHLSLGSPGAHLHDTETLQYHTHLSSSSSSSLSSSSSSSLSSSVSCAPSAPVPRPNAVHHQVNFLVQGSVSSVFLSPALSRALMRSATAISRKHSLRLHPELKWSACRNCSTPFVPGVTCCVRLQSVFAACAREHACDLCRRRKRQRRSCGVTERPEAVEGPTRSRSLSTRGGDRPANGGEGRGEETRRRATCAAAGPRDAGRGGHTEERLTAMKHQREQQREAAPEHPTEDGHGEEDAESVCFQGEEEQSAPRTKRRIRRSGMSSRMRNRQDREDGRQLKDTETSDACSPLSAFHSNSSSPSSSVSSSRPCASGVPVSGCSHSSPCWRDLLRHSSSETNAREETPAAFVVVTCLTCGVSRRRGALPQMPLEDESAER
ncbi:UNVERIFIED_CONTAM: hypothetical protein HHA_235720 [Hammondia hammondi]|eukprot:XP_008885527.1 hypothetical protein HHA_235720 [Hammondia hammondi]